MSIKSGLAFSQTTQNALQEAAALFMQNNVDDAYHILHEKIFLPYTQGKLTKAQADAVYRSMIPDPLSSPETPFSKRSCIPAIALRGHALKDLVAHYRLPEGNEKSAILNAANILETFGDEEQAWKILHKALIPSGNNESLINEVHRIMIDSLRTPTSSFLQKHVKEHPAILENNFLRAKTLECLSSHFFEKEVVEGSKIQLDSPILEFRAKTRSAMQQAAQLLREDKPEQAYELLKDAIWIPYQKGQLTGAQVDAVYKTLEDPYHPQTEFAKRQFHCLVVLRAQALRDFVVYYSTLPKDSSSGHQLDDVNAKNAILKAASLLETQGDLEEARKVLNDVLPFVLIEKSPGITDEIVKEIHCVMNDSFSAPTSAFLRKRIQENPSLVDENRLRAKALESLSSHFFDDAVVKGEAPKFKVFAGAEKAILEKNLAQLALSFLSTKEQSSFGLSSKSSIETVAKSIRYRKEVSWRELREWQLMGIKLDKIMLSGVRIINHDGVKEVDEAELNDILSLCGEHVEVLDFGPNQFKRSFLAVVGKYCPNLLSFTATNPDDEIDANALEGLTSGCSKLQHLSLKYCRLSSRISTESGKTVSALAAIAEYCPDLRSIDISGNGFYIEDSDIVILASGCKRLADVNAEGAPLGDTALRALAQCPLLRSLKLSDSYIQSRSYRAGKGDKNFTVEGMKIFVSGCRALEELSLISCAVRDDVLAVLGEAKLPLTKVTINMNYSLSERVAASPAGICSLIKGIPHVRELNVASNNLEDNVMEDIAEYCPFVTKLVISGNEHISAEAVNTVVSKCDYLTQLEMEKMGREIGYLYALIDSPCRLFSINFSSSLDDARRNRSEINEEIIAFIKKHKELRHIQLPPLFISDEVLFAIAENCPNLESLHIKQDQNFGVEISTEGLAALGKGCPHLKRLSARFFKAKPSIDELLKTMGENFPELTYLGFSVEHRQEYKISGSAFTALGKGCSKLSELRIWDYYISKYICDVISVACPSLKRIDCSGNISHIGSEFESLVKKSPSVSIRYSKGNIIAEM